MTAVARNDPGLAHGLARQLLEDEAREFRPGFFREQKRSGPSNPFKSAQRMLGDSVVATLCDRPTGSRAKFMLIAVVPGREQFHFMIAQRMPGWTKTQFVTAAIVSRHAIARTMQRTTGSDDHASVRAALAPFAIRLIGGPEAQPFWAPHDGRAFNMVELVGHAGALIGSREAFGPVIFKTWVAADQFIARQQRIHGTSADTMHINVIPAPSEEVTP
jgi:hypothetical protein